MQSSLSTEQANKIAADFPLFAKTFLKIQTKTGGLQPFSLNRIQFDLCSKILDGPNFKTTRWLLLKPRQVGATTFNMFLVAFWPAITRTDHHSLIIAHEEDLAAEILQRIRLAYELIPEQFRPRLSSDRRAALSFPDTRSTIHIGTATTQRKGSGSKLGRTYQSIYMTELADPRWEEDNIHMVLQTAPANAIIAGDSTPKGRARWFYNEWQKTKAGDSPFTGYFYPWYWDDDYKTKPRYALKLTEDEAQLKKTFGLSDDQIEWTRGKVREIGEEAFRELYPENDVDCFLFSGSPCFNMRNIEEYANSPQYAKDWPTLRGGLERVVPGSL